MIKKLQLLLCLSVFLLSACGGLKTLPPGEELIVGTWVLQSASYNGMEISAEKMGGEILFTFSKDGTATFITPEGETEEGRYTIESNQLIDPDSPENPAEIITLNRKKFVMAMEERGEKVVMNFIPNR